MHGSIDVKHLGIDVAPSSFLFIKNDKFPSTVATSHSWSNHGVSIRVLVIILLECSSRVYLTAEEEKKYGQYSTWVSSDTIPYRHAPHNSKLIGCFDFPKTICIRHLFIGITIQYCTYNLYATTG